MLKWLKQFLHLESAGGMLLLFVTLITLIISNSSLLNWYQTTIQTPLGFQFKHDLITKPFLFWINEGLMALFFLLVGLEIKRELLQEKGAINRILFPSIAALGGMIVPGIIYIYINYSNSLALKGWAIPVATDIAFAIGVLSLFGKRIPNSLRMFLLTLAIFDDLGAIIIIALFHTRTLTFASFLCAMAIMLILWLLKQLQIKLLTPYLVLGILLWMCILSSGIHATLAGVLLAMMIPNAPNERQSPSNLLANRLHPWVVFFILPLFAFANAGVSFAGMSWSILTEKITLGIILGLFIGKQVGVLLFIWIASFFKWIVIPKEIKWLELYGVAILCGIGFTMSLFLGTLAFVGQDTAIMLQVKVGVLVASLLSAVFGTFVLLIAQHH